MYILLQNLLQKTSDKNEIAIIKTLNNLSNDYDYKDVFKALEKNYGKCKDVDEWITVSGRTSYSRATSTIIELLKDTTVAKMLFDEFEIQKQKDKQNKKEFKKAQKQFPSVKDLSKVLYENGLIDFQFHTGKFKDGYCSVIVDEIKTPGTGVSAEVYGEDAFVYVRFDKDLNFNDLITKLKELNLNFEESRAISMSKNGINEVDFQVQYFKGWHWDE